MSRYEVWLTSDRGSKRYLSSPVFKYAEDFLNSITPSSETTSAYIAEFSAHGSQIIKTRSFLPKPIQDLGHHHGNFITGITINNNCSSLQHSVSCEYNPNLDTFTPPKQDPKMYIYTVVITDLNDKFLGQKSSTQKISIRDGCNTSSLLSTRCLGKAHYFTNEKLTSTLYFTFLNVDWVNDLFKDQPQPTSSPGNLVPTPSAPIPPQAKEESLPEWTPWSTAPPPHNSTVQARRYGAAAVEVDTKYLPSSFDPHGIEWK